MNKFSKTLRIMAATIREQAWAETAYLGNFWAELSSTAFYVVTSLIFIELLFTRIGSIAGYSKNDFLFMMLIGQTTFYVVAGVLANAMVLIIESVRSGNLDLFLLKPVAFRSHLYARALRPLNLGMTSLPNLVLFCLLINWSTIHVSLLSILAGVVVWLSGLIIFNTLLFALTLPVFTQGDASDMLNVYFATMSVTEMPYAKLPGVLKFLCHVVLPGLLMTAGTAAVMLMKDDAWLVIVPAIIAAFVSLLLCSWLWRFALRNYTSASS